MKKFSTIATVFAAALVAGSMSMTAFAASNPADDVSTYSYNTGRQAYEVFKAEEHPWFDNEDEATTANYSFHTGNQAAEARIEAFKEMPTGDDLTDEELAAFFEKYGMLCRPQKSPYVDISLYHIGHKLQQLYFAPCRLNIYTELPENMAKKYNKFT